MQSENMPITVIKAEQITRSFGDTKAVMGIDIKVLEGEIFGFLGPNGAGKTTSIKMLTTMLRPDSGSIEINGYDLKKNMTEAKASIGICQQQISLDKDLSVKNNIKHHAILRKMYSKDIKAQMAELVEIMGLAPFLDMKVNELSGGWRRRVSLVCSIIHRPKILFLDEPTAGLDTKSRHMLWDMIRRLNREGITIFLTTHYIEEAEGLCNRVAIINMGRTVAEGSPKELCDSIGSVTVEYLDERGAVIKKHFGDIKEGKEFMTGLNTGMSLRKTTLEDVFLTVTGEEYFRGETYGAPKDIG